MVNVPRMVTTVSFWDLPDVGVWAPEKRGWDVGYLGDRVQRLRGLYAGVAPCTTALISSKFLSCEYFLFWGGS